MVTGAVLREVGFTAALVLTILAAAALGLRWCMPAVFAALNDGGAILEIPDWSFELWFLLGLPWLFFALIVLVAEAVNWGVMSWLALLSSTFGWVVACAIAVIYAPMRVRYRLLRQHGTDMAEAALSAARGGAVGDELRARMQARLTELGAYPYSLRALVVSAIVAASDGELRAEIITAQCDAKMRRRSRIATLAIALAIALSVAGTLTMGLGAKHLWPPRHRDIRAEIRGQRTTLLHRPMVSSRAVGRGGRADQGARQRT